jgi:hypothetical protein
MQEELVLLARALSGLIRLIRGYFKGVIDKGSIVNKLGFIRAKEGINSVANRRLL